MCFTFGFRFCAACVACPAPDSPCEYRSGCLVWDMTSRGILVRRSVSHAPACPG